MSARTLEALVASPPERDELVVQLFVREGAQWGELFREGGRHVLELYAPGGTEIRRVAVEAVSAAALGQALADLGWALDVAEALEVVARADAALRSRLPARPPG